MISMLETMVVLSILNFSRIALLLEYVTIDRHTT